MAVITREGKGSALTFDELDNNFAELEVGINKNLSQIVTTSANTEFEVPAGEGIEFTIGASTALIKLNRTFDVDGTATTVSSPVLTDVDLSASTASTASGAGSLVYDPASKTYTYTPPDISSLLSGFTIDLSSQSLSGTIPSARLPSISLTSITTVTDEQDVADLSETTQEGDVVIQTNGTKSYVRNSGTAGTIADFTELLTPDANTTYALTTEQTGGNDTDPTLNLTPNQGTANVITIKGTGATTATRTDSGASITINSTNTTYDSKVSESSSSTVTVTGVSNNTVTANGHSLSDGDIVRVVETGDSSGLTLSGGNEFLVSGSTANTFDLSGIGNATSLTGVVFSKIVNNNPIVKLTGSDATVDSITLTGGTNVTVARNSDTQLTISSDQIGTANGILKATGNGIVSAAIASTDYIGATSGSAIQKADGAGGLTGATAGTDYIGATSGSAIQKGDGAGGLTGATAGTDFNSPNKVGARFRLPSGNNSVGGTLKYINVATISISATGESYRTSILTNTTDYASNENITELTNISIRQTAAFGSDPEVYISTETSHKTGDVVVGFDARSTSVTSPNNLTTVDIFVKLSSTGDVGVEGFVTSETFSDTTNATASWVSSFAVTDYMSSSNWGSLSGTGHTGDQAKLHSTISQEWDTLFGTTQGIVLTNGGDEASDITVISDGTGFLKNNGSGNYSYDNSTYLTAAPITVAQTGSPTATDADPAIKITPSSGSASTVTVVGGNNINVTRNSDTQLTIDTIADIYDIVSERTVVGATLNVTSIQNNEVTVSGGSHTFSNGDFMRVTQSSDTNIVPGTYTVSNSNQGAGTFDLSGVGSSNNINNVSVVQVDNNDPSIRINADGDTDEVKLVGGDNVTITRNSSSEIEFDAHDTLYAMNVGQNSGSDSDPFLTLDAAGTGTDDTVKFIGGNGIDVDRTDSGDSITISNVRTNALTARSYATGTTVTNITGVSSSVFTATGHALQTGNRVRLTDPDGTGLNEGDYDVSNAQTNQFTLSGAADSSDSSNVVVRLLTNDNPELLFSDSVNADTAVQLFGGTGISVERGADNRININADTDALTTVQTATGQTAHLALTTEQGDVVVRTDQKKTYMHNGGSANSMADFTEISDTHNTSQSLIKGMGTPFTGMGNITQNGIAAQIGFSSGHGQNAGDEVVIEDTTGTIPSGVYTLYSPPDPTVGRMIIANSNTFYINGVDLTGSPLLTSNSGLTVGPAVATDPKIQLDTTAEFTTGDDFIEITGGTNTTVTRNSDSQLTIASEDTWQQNTVSQEGYVIAPTVSNANKVWKTDGSGNPSWRDDADTQNTYDLGVVREDVAQLPSVTGGGTSGGQPITINFDDVHGLSTGDIVRVRIGGGSEPNVTPGYYQATSVDADTITVPQAMGAPTNSYGNLIFHSTKESDPSVRLTGSDSSDDKVVFTGGNAIDVTRTSDTEITVAGKANAVGVNGYVTGPVNDSTGQNKVWKTDASGVPAWRDDLDTTLSTGNSTAIQKGDGNGGLANASAGTDYSTLALGTTNTTALAGDTVVDNLLLEIPKSSNTLNSGDKSWLKVATVTIDARYQYYSAQLAVVGTGASEGVANEKILAIRVKQQAQMGQAPLVDIDIYNNGNEDYDFGHVVAVNSGTETRVDIYFRPDGPNSGAEVYKMADTVTATVAWSSTGNSYATSAPANFVQGGAHQQWHSGNQAGIFGSLNGLLKANGSGVLSAAVAGTDYSTLAIGTSATTAMAGNTTFAFADITSKPTTISGYGITDSLAIGTSATTAMAGNTTFAFSDITSKPTTISGYGITDALTIGTSGTTAMAGNTTFDRITEGDTSIIITDTGTPPSADNNIVVTVAGSQRAKFDYTGTEIAGGATNTQTIGSTTQTGTITLGRSTKDNTINIGNAATESDQEQIINIGSGTGSGTSTVNIAAKTSQGNDTAVTIGGNDPSTGTCTVAINGTTTVGLGNTTFQGNNFLVNPSLSTNTITLGSTSGTGTITIGRSTAQQDILIGAGATVPNSGVRHIQLGELSTGVRKITLEPSNNTVDVMCNANSLNQQLTGINLYNTPTTGNTATTGFQFGGYLGQNKITSYYGSGSSADILMNFAMGGDKFIFTGLGRLGVGTTNPAQELHVVGDIIATGNVTAYYSDERLKDLKGAIPNALEKVNKLTGYYYTPNDLAHSLGVDNTGIEVGVSAQEVESVLPEVVTDSAVGMSEFRENYKTVQYDRLTPLLIESIKELTQKVAELEAKLEERGE